MRKYLRLFEAMAFTAVLAHAGASSGPRPANQDHPSTNFTTCADVAAQDPTDAGAVTPVPDLPVHKPVSVEVHFFNAYDGEPPIAWTALQKQYVCAAARRFAMVWSSEVFYQRLQHLPRLTLSRKFIFKKISGPELYAELTAHPIAMSLALTTDPGLTCAATTSGPDQTVLVAGYIDRQPGKAGCGDDGSRGTSLVEDLTDTLSHEYTHYAVAVQSTDSGVKNNWRYVSYGIGCLTENLAVPGDDCSFDPSRH